MVPWGAAGGGGCYGKWSNKNCSMNSDSEC